MVVMVAEIELTWIVELMNAEFYNTRCTQIIQPHLQAPSVTHSKAHSTIYSGPTRILYPLH